MNVWLTIPSARPVSEIADRIQRWQAQGYRIALWRNGPHVNDPLLVCAGCGKWRPFGDGAACTVCGCTDFRNLLTNRDALKSTPEYAGWGPSINALIAALMVYDPHAAWFVGGGDDTEPDPSKTAQQIAMECQRHFFLHNYPSGPDGPYTLDEYSTFGVMQPTGDRWGADEPWAQAAFPDAPAYIDRICGSPWIGREFARRANQGKGPFWPEYHHMFADEELQEVAKAYGVLWQRRDLMHYHEHPRRDGVSRTPDFAQEIYSPEHWAAAKALFSGRKVAGFPGSELM